MDLAAFGIDARHHMLDDTVLAGGVHALEHDQHRPFAVGEQALLHFGELGDTVVEDSPYVLDIGREAEGLGRIESGELEMIRSVDPALLDDLSEIHRDLEQKAL